MNMFVEDETGNMNRSGVKNSKRMEKKTTPFGSEKCIAEREMKI